MNSRIETFLKMLEQGQDSALLRFAIGNEYLLADQAADAIDHLRKATELDRSYSAAWKLLGKACVAAGDKQAAMEAFAAGIDAAGARGDRQAAKEMAVFLRRLQANEDEDTP